MKLPLKRLVSFTQLVLTGVFNDVRYMYTSVKEWERDKARLLNQVACRGITALALDLPALEKHLHRCLDLGVLCPCDGFLSRTRADGITPLFLGVMYQHIFDREGRIRDTPSAEAIQALKTIYSFGKKIPLECTQENIDAAIKEFVSTDSRLPRPSLNWDLDELDDSGHLDLSKILGISAVDYRVSSGWFSEPGVCKEWLEHVQRCFDITAVGFPAVSSMDPSLRPRHGPGAVSEGTRFLQKYGETSYPRKLAQVFPPDAFVCTDFGYDLGSNMLRRLDNREPPSRLIAVPKTVDKPRLIAAEPVWQQWAQQAIMAFLESAMRRDHPFMGNCVTIRDQGPNQILALEGSRSRRVSTVDLSEASDRVSCRLVERAFRRNPALLNLFHAARTRYVDCGPNFGHIRLKKFAAMGSAVTFPVQSILFAAIGMSSVLLSRGLPATLSNMKRVSREVRVYGDDIIVPVDALEILKGLLHHFDLKVNVDKTFADGNFRESCGVDAFNGHIVTGQKLRMLPKGSLSAVPALVEFSNNLHKAGYWFAADAVRTFLRRWNHLIPVRGVPTQCNQNHSSKEGWRKLPVCYESFLGSSDEGLRSRWNDSLFLNEVRTILVRAKETSHSIAPWARLTRFFTERPDPMSKWTSDTTASRIVTVREGWATSDSQPKGKVSRGGKGNPTTMWQGKAQP